MDILKQKAAIAVIGLIAASTTAWAEFPVKPITLVVPFSAGGPSDKIARDLAEAMRKPLDQTVVVDNTAGAGGTIGAARVARATPDGYTLLVHHIGMSTAPTLYKKLPYKTLEDFEYLGLINEAPSILIGRPGLTATHLAELRTWISANDGKVNLANAGVGSASHLCSLVLQATLKSKMTLVPYKGTAPAMTDLMGGQVDLMCEQAINAVPQIEAKKVKVYGVTSQQRMPLPVLTQVPTLAEAGLTGFEMSVWHGVYAPKGTPPAVLAKLNAAIRTALKDPELIKREEALGVRVVTDSRLEPAEHKKYVESEINRWSKIIQDSGVTVD
ncbi:tripartite tricarboxylate transporter substrate-binding protein [Comamonas sp. CMM02]|jgi:tripartite-type tricarboxylate transporter receptor subunit TctC|uniref:tripartite tricarboxylate transporter substrate-binding protein n=1 Tax=Comamonas sp. CMM02 TaxID=2769307 RepID=UPI00177AA20D|nr:tripartite tricarboxylate transporter substrate-binding protein [Comamonas sp. CMM02]MBD9401910.1 tripartite tricarboxylate transporter substrate binding protein BugD [Comamonas sp. CMM02]